MRPVGPTTMRASSGSARTTSFGAACSRRKVRIASRQAWALSRLAPRVAPGRSPRARPGSGSCRTDTTRANAVRTAVARAGLPRGRPQVRPGRAKQRRRRVGPAEGARHLHVQPEVVRGHHVQQVHTTGRRPLAEEAVEDEARGEGAEEEHQAVAHACAAAGDLKQARDGEQGGEGQVAGEIGQEAAELEGPPVPVVAGRVHDPQVVDPQDRGQEGQRTRRGPPRRAGRGRGGAVGGLGPPPLAATPCPQQLTDDHASQQDRGRGVAEEGQAQKDAR